MSEPSRLRRGLASAGAVTILAGRAGAALARLRLSLVETGRQVEAIGYRSLSVVVLTAIFSSMVMTVQFALQLARFGAKEYVSNVVSLSLVRELGPVLTALMVGGRVGAGIAAELGSMQVTEQIDAMRAMGADPVEELVLPRVAAATLTLPLLTALACVLGIAGGMGIAWVDQGIRPSFFFHSTLHAVELGDLAGGLVKSAFFGFTMALIACQRGLAARGGTQGVGRATTETVVITSIVTLVSDFVLTKLLLGLGL